jgi:hypothetical protein
MSLAALCLLPCAPSEAPAHDFDAEARAALYAFEAAPQQSFEDVVAERRRRGRLYWEPEQMVLQGFIGASSYETVSRPIRPRAASRRPWTDRARKPRRCP